MAQYVMRYLGVAALVSLALLQTSCGAESADAEFNAAGTSAALTVKDPVCLSSGDYQYDVNAWLRPTMPAGITLEPASAWSLLGSSTSYSGVTTRGVLRSTFTTSLADAQQARVEFAYLGKVADSDAAYLSGLARRWQVAAKLRAHDAAGDTVLYVTWRFRELVDEQGEIGPSVAVQVKRDGLYYNPTEYRVTQALDGTPIQAPVTTNSISHVNTLRAVVQNQSLQVWLTVYGDSERLVWSGNIDTGAAAPGATSLGLVGFRTDNVATRIRTYGLVGGDTHTYESTRRDCSDYHAEVPAL